MIFFLNSKFSFTTGFLRFRRFKVKDPQKLSTKALQSTRQDHGKTCMYCFKKLHGQTKCIFL